MGLEIKTVARQGKNKAVGKLHLDSQRLEFRSKEFRWSIDLGPMVKASTRGQTLTVSSGRDKIMFDIGDDGKRWVDKILNPPGRLDKLGVKPQMVCWMSKGFPRDFTTELKSRDASVTRQIGKCQLAFFLLSSRDQLGDLLTACDSLPDKTNIWAVYPKGDDRITQSDVMKAMKEIGFGPGKTAAFDDGWSSMRYAKKK